MSNVVDQTVADTFSALGNKTRLSVIRQLSSGSPVSATRLSDDESVTRQNIVKHLKILETAGLVKREKRGREVLYMLEVARVEDANAFLSDVAAGWDRAIDRLRQIVE